MGIRHPEQALLPYLRGELEGEERARVARHLAECPRCRESAQSFAAVLRTLARDLDSSPPPPDLASYRAEIFRKLAESGRPQAHGRRRRAAWAAGAVAGAAAAALAIALWLRPGVQPGQPSVDQLALESEMAGTDIGLLRNYPVIEHLDLIENYDVIANLDRLSPPPQAPDASRS